ncbi:MAG: hypothetical protein PHH60_01180 [Candidatus Margulisbacteria bacterium]|nr:hypothetical protein [Candidatus Margulisiibacteriota bacterium]
MNKARYYISKENEFVIENYNSAPTFASFFPGIAGVFGCPMWVFYTNRGQGITSAGVLDKNSSIMEFQPANKAYRLVSLQGFRTFIKDNGKLYEPFSDRSSYNKEMKITPHSFKIVEENDDLNLRIEVTYFTIPNERFPALARIVKIVNLSGKEKKLEVVDGLPIIIPFGFDDSLLKRISQTTEAWCAVENLGAGAPFYKLKVLPADISETKFLEKGNFLVSFCRQSSPVSFIVDPKVVFGENTSLEIPENFASQKNFKIPANQLTEGFTPSAFAFSRFELPPNGEFELCSLLGQMDNLELLNRVKPQIANRQYLAAKFEENRSLIDDICSAIKIESSSKSFDLYSGYTFLDNAMRGGLPVKVGGKIVYVYYRKHGDMERDYNDFKLIPTYFSQGNGNYRDINQNRRNDLFFNPDIAEDNILRFFNLIQLDGFNPLVVLNSQYYIRSTMVADALIKQHIKNTDGQLLEMITRPFLPGAVLRRIENFGLEYKTSREKFLRELMANSSVEESAYHGEGFWTDHAFYNTDLLESFEGIYPEKMAEILFQNKSFTFFDNDHVVAPRRDKYKLSGKDVRQYESVRFDVEKATLIKGRGRNRNAVRTEFGRGKSYFTTLIAKLLCIAANKAASFDAEGIGLEMEADKPNWYDALNGLPGLLGSSLSETLELKRLCAYILKFLADNAEIVLPVEVKELVELISEQLSKAAGDFEYWDETYKIKEAYRQKTRLGISGEEGNIDGKSAADFLKKVIKKCDLGIKKTLKKYGNYYTYFINEVAEYELEEGKYIKVKRFTQKPLPLFLEGFVHALKVEKDKKVYKLVKDSPLYDQKLKMYKVNAPLEDTPIEIGRSRIFTPGWLENESIWLHMEYKYMLELLKAGLYKEFFADFKDVLIPFMDPKVYKRSILENSSLIVSSAHPNKENHGRGFVARLSGGAAEFIDMWIVMTTGKNIFYLDKNGQLCFRLSPILPAWLFNKGKLGFKLLGAIEVEYINKSGQDTFDGGVKPVSYKLTLEDKEVNIAGPVVKEPYAGQIRSRKVKKIVVTLE